MRTKAELKKIISDRLVGSFMKSVSIDDLIQVMQSSQQTQKDKFMNFMYSDQEVEAAKMLRKIIELKSRQAADEEASTILADDQLSLEELDKIL